MYLPFFYTVQQQTAAIVQGLGKFKRVAHAGPHLKMPFVETVAARVTLWERPAWAARCRLDETIIEDLPIGLDGALTLNVGPWQAATLRVRPLAR